MQYLEGVKSISGPVSCHVFRVPIPSGKRDYVTLYLMGDEHMSYENMCEACSREKGCYPIDDFIEQAAESAEKNKWELDVFMEMPFYSKQDPEKTEMLQTWDTLLRQDSDPLTAVENFMRKLVGRSPRYIGIFSRLYRKFSDKLYHASSRARKSKVVRFHQGDARHEFFVRTMFCVDKKKKFDSNQIKCLTNLHVHLDTIEKFKSFMMAFLVDKNFEKSITKLFGKNVSIPEKLLTTFSNSGNGVFKCHKIAKQFHKLPEYIRPVVMAYIEERVDTLLSVMQEHFDYEANAASVKKLEASKEGDTKKNEAGEFDDLFAMFRKLRLYAYFQQIKFFIYLPLHTVFMDVYMLCRMLYFMTTKHSGKEGAVIAYAGDAHIRVYVRFFKKYMKLRPVFCKALSANRQQETSRCVHVKGTCKTSEIKKASELLI